MINLGVNIDHIATIRQARLGLEPDPVWAAIEAELGGADGITFHVREDRRHMQDDDVRQLKQTIQTQMNFELAAADDVIALALEISPQMAMLVPERRAEVTTEGGLNVAGQLARMTEIVARFKSQNIRTSAFIDADPDQIRAAAKAGFEVCEIHTGPYALSTEKYRDFNHPAIRSEYEKIITAGKLVTEINMQFNAGHGLNYRNVQPVAAIPNIAELHIGHSIVSRAVFTGMRNAVSEMKRLMIEAATNPQPFRLS